MPDDLPPDAPAPRLCHLIKWPDFDGYGFNLHAEKSKSGQFVGKVDELSPAQAAGLREGDRIIEVNGVNIANENHRQVVERIKANPRETKLLVIEESGDIWYKAQGLVIKGSQANVIFQATPERRSEKEEDECAAVVLDDETVSGESGTDEEGQAVAGVGTAAAVAESSGANDCVRNESEEESAFSSPSSPSPSSVSTELKNRVDSKDEKVEESEAVPMQSQAAVEPEIVGSDSPAGVVVAAVTSSGDSGSLLQDRQEKADASTGAAVADQKEDLKEAEAEPRGVDQKEEVGTMEVKSEEVVVISSAVEPMCNGQKDPDRLNNNNTIEGEALKSSSRDVVDSIAAQVNQNGMNGHPVPTEGSPAIPASPTSLKSNSSGSTSGNALSSLGSGGEGNLETSLNMSVSQMRQMLAQKKKVDPKKVAMDLKQKYEIISSM